MNQDKATHSPTIPLGTPFVGSRREENTFEIYDNRPRPSPPHAPCKTEAPPVTTNRAIN